MIDLILAGDNAIVIGLAAAGLPPEQRTRAILVGIVLIFGLGRSIALIRWRRTALRACCRTTARSPMSAWP